MYQKFKYTVAKLPRHFTDILVMNKTIYNIKKKLFNLVLLTLEYWWTNPTKKYGPFQITFEEQMYFECRFNFCIPFP